MSERIRDLTGTIEKQNEILSELLDILVKQRDALKAGHHSDLQSLMSSLRHVSVRCQAIEAKRSKCADELAAELGCAPVVSEIMAQLPDGDVKDELKSAAHQLTQLVERLKIEMTVIGKLMEEAKTLNEMLISEWQKLSLKSLGSGAMGTFDAKI